MPTCSYSHFLKLILRFSFSPLKAAVDFAVLSALPHFDFVIPIVLLFSFRILSAHGSLLLSIWELSNIRSDSPLAFYSSLVFLEILLVLTTDFPFRWSIVEYLSVFGQTSAILTEWMKQCSCSSFSQPPWSSSLSTISLFPSIEFSSILLSILSNPLEFFLA